MVSNAVSAAQMEVTLRIVLMKCFHDPVAVHERQLHHLPLEQAVLAVVVFYVLLVSTTPLDKVRNLSGYLVFKLHSLGFVVVFGVVLVGFHVGFRRCVLWQFSNFDDFTHG